MIAVSDSGPLHYLRLIGCEFVLSDLFERVLLPEAVYAELHHEHTPQIVSDWISDPPDWLEIVPVEASEPPKRLGKGEWEAIRLALSLPQGVTLLTDDNNARGYAEQLGLHVVGTLGMLVHASSGNKLHLREVVERLLGTNFRANPRLIRTILGEE